MLTDRFLNVIIYGGCALLMAYIAIHVVVAMMR